MATRAVNKTAKEGEQNARLLLSRGALSAMAIFRRAAFPSVRRWRCTAPYPLLAPAAPALCLSCFWRGRSPSPARRFFAGRAAVIWCGANPGARPWQDLRECVFGRLVVAIYSRGAFLGSPMTKCSRNAFPSVRQWQDCALMRSWPDWQWQYTRAVRPQASIRGKIPPRCVPGRLPMEKCSQNAFPGGNPWQVLRSMHPESGLGRENRQFAARFARHASEMSWLWQDMRAMHPKSPANRLSGTHGAKILPGRTPFRCTGPSNHARRTDFAIRRSAKPPERSQPRSRRTVRAARARSPGPRNTAREAAPPSLPGQQVPPAAPAPPPPLFANTSQ